LVEVDFAVRSEFARGVEDVLVRRLGLEHDPRTLEKTIDRTASRMRRLLGWSPEREHQEVRHLRERLRSTEQRVRNALARSGESGRPVTSP
jgi:glycerol-3-phosphate dehydrogenase